jgi:hypothetical protein
MGREETQKTLTALALAALLLFLLTRAAWLPHLAAALLALELTENRLGAAVARGWQAFGRFLGAVNNKVLLFLIYYLVLTPTALLYRLFNPAAAGHFRRCPEGSMFHDIQADAASKESFEKTW